MLAVVTVDTVEDIVDLNDGRTSLREAIFATNTVPGADEINFDFGFDGPATILLTQGELQITDSLTINGDGADLLIIDGNGSPSPIFHINDQRSDHLSLVMVSGLTLTGSLGSAIVSRENLTVESSVLRNNQGSTGGAIHVGIGVRQLPDVELTIRDSEIRDNTSRRGGGGIYFRGRHGSLTIENSLISNNATSNAGAGGGIHAGGFDNEMLFENVTFAGNSAGFGGGAAIRDDNANLATIVDSVITENTAATRGGGLDLSGKPVDIIGTTITHNTALQQAQGGGIFASDRVSVSNSDIAHNSAGSGGGIWVGSNARFNLTHSKVYENQATIGNGGGIGADSGEVSIATSEIFDNTAAGDGGGVFRAKTIVDSTISDNVAAGNGGGVMGALQVESTTISSNAAGENGGGLYLGSSNALVWVRNSTVVANVADAKPNGHGVGGGIYGWRLAGVAHTIVSGNTDSGEAPDVAGLRAVRFSLIGDNTGSELSESPSIRSASDGNLIGGPIHGMIDPLLAPLADNGGPTLTHALLPGSPAINAGDLNAVVGENGVPEFDQRGEGFDRIVSRIDIGAYEVQEPGDMNLLVDTLEDESDGDFSRGDLSLREAIELANANPVPDTIHFDASLNGGTILLTQGELQVTDSLTINGPGRDLLTIDASGNDPTPDSTYEDGDNTNDQDGSLVLHIDDGAFREYSQVAVLDLTLTGGDHGGAVESEEDLFLQRVSIIANSGGGVKSGGTLEIDNSLITENSGSGIVSGQLTLSDSTISDNSDTGIVTFYSSSVIYNSVISGNTSPDSAGGLHLRGSVHISHTMITNNSALRRGGGVYLDGSGTTEIRDSTIAGNSVQDDDGGGIRIYGGGIVTITSSTITGNSSSLRGGGIYLRGGALYVERSVISNNYTRKLGGGIYSRGKTIITSSRVLNNAAVYSSGGLALHGEATILDSLISGNSASDGGGIGISVYNRSQEIAITDSTITENTADEDGGGIVSGAPLEITGSTISGNSAGGNGGGIHLETRGRGEPRLNLTTSTVSGNTANGNGGGIAGPGPMTISHSTITHNIADADGDGDGAGGGITEGSITLDHTIVSGNIDHSSTANDIAGIFDSTRSLIGLGAEFLGPLQDNGGPTLTHALLPGSPAIDAGDVNLVAGESGVPVFDQRGNPYQRVFGSRIDIGAYEFQPIPGDFDGDGDADADDLAEWESGYGSQTSGADFLNWQRTFGDGVPAEAAASIDAARALDETAALDLALAATLAIDDVTEEVARGPVARRNAYSETAKSSVREFAMPAPPQRELAAANEHARIIENSNDAALDIALDEFFPAI